MRSERGHHKFSFLSRDYRDRIESMERHRQAVRSFGVLVGIGCLILVVYVVSFFV